MEIYSIVFIRGIDLFTEVKDRINREKIASQG